MANAKAIIAVPDLIATLKEELDAIIIWQDADLPSDVREGLQISRAKIKAALAKAGV